MSDLSITATEVLPGSSGSKLLDGTAAEAITPGQTVARSGVTIYLFDADSTTTVRNTLAGVAVNEAVAAGQPVKYEAGDEVIVGTTAAPVVGKVYLGSRTSGGITPAGDSTNTGHQNIVGVGAASGKLKLVLFAAGVTGTI